MMTPKFQSNPNKTTTVSVGLPVYNRPDMLKRILGILHNQTFQDFELVISDNHSPTEAIEEIVKLFMENNPNQKVKFYRQSENIGVLKNADFVLQNSSSEFFCWVSDDDWRSEHFLEYLVDEFKKSKNSEVACVFCDYTEVYENFQYAEGFPKSHLKIFQKLQHTNRTLRLSRYFLMDAGLGKGNIFYGLYRTKFLKSINFEKTTGNNTFLNMDCLIVFQMLQESTLGLRDELLCTLTCGNQKFHPYYKSSSKLFPLIQTLIVDELKDSLKYLSFTQSTLDRCVLSLLIAPKMLNKIFHVLYKKLFHKYPNTFNGKSFLKALFQDIQLKMNTQPKVNYDIQRAEETSRQNLKGVTLIAVATKGVEETLFALKHSMKQLDFEKVVLVSHYKPFNYFSPDIGPVFPIEHRSIHKMKNVDEWSYEVTYNLKNYVDTEFCLLIHADGFVVNPNQFRPEFLEYDYIGAPWPMPTDDFSYRDDEGEIVRVGNSVSFRSKKLLELPSKINLPWEPFHGYYNEDGFICVKNKKLFEGYGIKFAPIDVAKFFSHENMIPEIEGIKPFVFHKWFGTNKHYPRF